MALEPALVLDIGLIDDLQKPFGLTPFARKDAGELPAKRGRDPLGNVSAHLRSKFITALQDDSGQLGPE